ncbi:MAG: DUF4433 domain-containing protein [Lysobacterales bacterium]
MTAIYHITHLDNLPDIVARGELLADTQIQRAGLKPCNIAHGNIKQRRATVAIPIPPGGVVADYVPFYFCPRSPMLYAIHGGKVQNYPGGQEQVLHLVLEAESLAADVACVHTDGNAATRPIMVYAGTSGFSKLPWDVINSWSWHDTPEDNDRKRRKQAEFLVWQRLPWTAIARIGVIGANIADRVAQHLAGQAHRPAIEIHKDWYYR